MSLTTSLLLGTFLFAYLSLSDVRKRFSSAVEKELWLPMKVLSLEKENKNLSFYFAFRSLICTFVACLCVIYKRSQNQKQIT